MENTWETYLNKVYSTPGESAAFSSVEKLYNLLKNKKYNVTRLKIKNWLNQNYTYVIHKARIKSFPRNPIIAQYIDHNWQADILFLPDIATFNDRKPCMMVCIDVISRYAWAESMMSKRGKDTSKAFEKIITTSGRQPEKLQTDKGTEFYNSDFKKVLKKYNIKLYSTESDKKAAIAERCIKEIKKLIYRYMTDKQTNRYIDELKNIMKTYNSTYHSSIGMAPDAVTEENTGTVLESLYGKLWSNDRISIGGRNKITYKIGDNVRIAIASDLFKKGYKGFWTTEIFTITKIKRVYPYTQYQLSDSTGDVLKGLFYPQEIQLADIKSQRFTRIKKILKKKYIKNKLWYLVNWEGEPDSLKRWVLASTIVGN